MCQYESDTHILEIPKRIQIPLSPLDSAHIHVKSDKNILEIPKKIQIPHSSLQSRKYSAHVHFGVYSPSVSIKVTKTFWACQKKTIEVYPLDHC